MILDRIFATRGRISVLRILSTSKAKLSISDLARATGLTKAGVSKIIDDLVSTGLLISERKGNMLLLSLNEKNEIGNIIGDVFEWESEIENNASAGVYSAILDEYSSKNVVSIILFGSRSRGNESLESDFDVLVICKDVKAKAESKIINGFLVNIFKISKNDLIKKIKERDPFIMNVIRDAKVKKGKKEFYGIIKEARI